MDVSIKDLLDCLRGDGSLADWEQFLELYLPLMEEWARHHVRPGEDPVNLVDETVTGVIERISSFPGSESNMAAWVRGVMTTCARERRPKEIPWAKRVDPVILEAVAGKGEEGGALEAAKRDHLLARVLQIVKPDFQPATVLGVSRRRSAFRRGRGEARH
jgi:DNA-directed RNA polymerase specialized sigma24 family protein